MALIQEPADPIRLIIEAGEAQFSTEYDHQGWGSMARTTVTIEDPTACQQESLGLDDIATRHPANHDIEYLIRRVKALQESLDKARESIRLERERYEESKSKWRKKHLPTPTPEW